MSLISLFTHMCAIGFAVLAIIEKSRERKNLVYWYGNNVLWTNFYNLILNLFLVIKLKEKNEKL